MVVLRALRRRQPSRTGWCCSGSARGPRQHRSSQIRVSPSPLPLRFAKQLTKDMLITQRRWHILSTVLRRELDFGVPRPNNDGVKLAADLGMLGPSDACGGYGHACQRRCPTAGGYSLTLGGSGGGLHGSPGSPGSPSGGSSGETLRLGTGSGACCADAQRLRPRAGAAATGVLVVILTGSAPMCT
jgi:hypothetical protein